MAMNYPARKTFLYCFNNFSCLEGSDQIEGLCGFKASPKIDGRNLTHGTGRIAYGRTRGTFSVECELTFLLEAFYEFRKKHPQFLDEEFNIVGVNEEGSRRNKIEIIGLVFDSFEIAEEGTEAIKVAVPGIALDMKIDDQRLILGDALGLGNDAGGG